MARKTNKLLAILLLDKKAVQTTFILYKKTRNNILKA